MRSAGPDADCAGGAGGGVGRIDALAPITIGPGGGGGGGPGGGDGGAADGPGAGASVGPGTGVAEAGKALDASLGGICVGSSGTGEVSRGGNSWRK